MVFVKLDHKRDLLLTENLHVLAFAGLSGANSNQTFLSNRSDQHPVSTKNLPIYKSSTYSCTCAVHGVQHPIITTDLAMKPNGMIQTGGKETRVSKAYSVDLSGRAYEAKIACIGKRTLMF